MLGGLFLHLPSGYHKLALSGEKSQAHRWSKYGPFHEICHAEPKTYVILDTEAHHDSWMCFFHTAEMQMFSNANYQCSSSVPVIPVVHVYIYM